jgi:hypothetical protein
MNQSNKLHGYYKVGRLRKPIADKIRRPAADIYVDDNHLQHVKIKHGRQGIARRNLALAYIMVTIDECDAIYAGSNNALLLVSMRREEPDAVVIELLPFDSNTDIYLVKTASRRKAEFFKHKDMLWKK